MTGRLWNRAGVAAARAVAVGLGAIAVVTEPSLTVGWLVLGATVTATASLIAMSPPNRNRTTTRRRTGIGILAGAATAAGLTVLTGLVVVLGSAAAAVLPVVLLACALRLWQRWRRRPQPEPAVLVPDSPANDPVRPTTLPPAALQAMSVADLCLAWRHSYRELLDAPAGQRRPELVALRQQLLDELERRDQVGFDRWLETGAGAGSDPSRYLTER